MLLLTLKLLTTKAKLTLVRLGYGITYAILAAPFIWSLSLLKTERLWVTLRILILKAYVIASGFPTMQLSIKKSTSGYKKLG